MQKTGKVLTTILLTTTAFLFVLNTSCRRNNSVFPTTSKCANVVCKNGALCSDGVCLCSNGLEDKDCGTKAVDRYTGTWTMHDSIIVTDHPTMLGHTSTYTITITEKPGTFVSFYINGIMGNLAYKNVDCHMEDTSSSIYNAFHYRMRQYQGLVGPPQMIIVSGEGTLNGGGYYMTGKYTRNYPLADSTAQTDELVFYAVRQQ